MKTAAVYIRVSTDDQLEYSPDAQLIELKKYAKQHDIIIDAKHIYTDAGISGRKATKRPQFQKMIAAAKAKPSPFDIILVWKFSRFARNQEESILYKSLLSRECHVDVVSITEETSDGMFGSLIERIIEWMDEFYSVRLGQEVKSKMTIAAEQGKVQTIAPFGYSKKPNEPMVINEEEAGWIRYIFKEFIDGKTLFRIAQSLNQMGIKTHRNNQFENRTVEYILRNPMYAGYVRWTPTGKTLSKRIYDDKNTIKAKGDFEPILAEDLFNAANELLDARKKTRKKYDKPVDVKKHWLSGLVKCSNCGSTLVFSPANNGFQCHKYASGTCKQSHYISAKKLEQFVIEALEQVVVTDEFIKNNTVEEKDSNSIDFSKQFERLNNLLERAKAAYLAGIDTIDEYGENKKKIMAEINELKVAEEHHKIERKFLTKKEVEAELVDIIKMIKGNYDKNVKNSAITSVVSKIVFSRVSGSIDIYFRF